MKRQAGVVCVLLLLAAGTVCPAAAAAPDGAQARPRIRITYATPITQSDLFERGEKQVLTRFMAENPDVEVVARQIPFDNYDMQVLLAARAGRPPDVGRVNHSTVQTWAGAGYLVELDDFVARSTVIDPNDYWPGFWNICRIRGKLYAVPLGTDCRVLLCHVGLFRQAGVRPPRTWNELVEAARKIHRPHEKVYGIAFPTNNEWSATYDVIGNFLVANGGRIIDDDGTRGTIASDPRAAEAFRFVCELVTVHKVCPPGMANLGGDVIESLFVNGRLGMMVSGPWVRAGLHRLRPDFEWKIHYDMVPIPAGPATGRSGSSQGGWLIGVFQGSPHREAALRLLEYFSRPESFALMAGAENLPPRRAAMSLGPFQDPFYQVFFEQLPNARPPVALVPQLPNVARAIQRAYQRVVAGGAGVDETLAWLENELTNHLLR